MSARIILDHAVMIDQGFGYPAIKRRLRQVAQAKFSRTPFPARVVQGAVKFGTEIVFDFSAIGAAYTIPGALSPIVGRISQ